MAVSFMIRRINIIRESTALGSKFPTFHKKYQNAWGLKPLLATIRATTV
jgi:hypothetical protein